MVKVGDKVKYKTIGEWYNEAEVVEVSDDNTCLIKVLVNEFFGQELLYRTSTENLIVERRTNMTEIEEMQSKIDELSKRLDELKKQKDENGGRWRVGIGEKYYYIFSNNEVTYTHNTSDWDKGAFAIGNYFKTEEEAKFVVERLKVMEELRQFAEPEDREWGGDKRHWYFYYNFLNEKIEINRYTAVKANDIYFETESMAKKAIEAVGEERIKKYYLCVK